MSYRLVGEGEGSVTGFAKGNAAVELVDVAEGTRASLIARRRRLAARSLVCRPLQFRHALFHLLGALRHRTHRRRRARPLGSREHALAARCRVQGRLPAHKNDEVRRIIEARRGAVALSAVRSRPRNPIELAFAKLKAHLRKAPNAQSQRSGTGSARSSISSHHVNA